MRIGDRADPSGTAEELDVRRCRGVDTVASVIERRARDWVAWGVFGAVVVINTLLSVTAWMLDWWREQADPAMTSLPRLLEPVLDLRSGASDADVHFFLWSVAAITGWWAVRRAAGRIRSAFFVGLWAYTAALELIQRWVPERAPQWIDLVANALGIAAGATAGYLVSRLLGRTDVEPQGAESSELEHQAVS